MLQAFYCELHKLLFFTETNHVKHLLGLITHEECSYKSGLLSLKDKVAQNNEINCFVPEHLLVPKQREHLVIASYQTQNEREQFSSFLQE